VYRGFICGSSTVSIFLDIKGAFDNVIPNILIQDLGKIGIPARTRSFIYNLINERHLHFVVDGNLLGPFLTHKGTPQGSTLSPILFDIYLRDITSHLHPESKILLYADNIVIYSTNKDILKAQISVQTSLDRITEYLRLRGLILSPEKSNWMSFTRNRRLPFLDTLRIFNNPVPRTESVRFLGIVLDTRLSGKNHFQHLIRKGSFTPFPIKGCYRATFRGAIEYGCQILQE